MHTVIIHTDNCIENEFETAGTISLVICIIHLSTILPVEAKKAKGQTANQFIWHRIYLPVTVAMINVMVFVNAWIYPRLWLRLLNIAIIHIILLYTPTGFVNSLEIYPKFQLRFLKTIRISRKQWIAVILFHVITGTFYATIFIYSNTEPIFSYFNVGFLCQVLNICSIPLWIPALKALNSDTLEFSMKNSATGEDWNGFLSKTVLMEWTKRS